MTTFAALLIVEGPVHTIQVRAAGSWGRTGRLLVPSPAGGEAWGEEPLMQLTASPPTHRPQHAGESGGQ